MNIRNDGLNNAPIPQEENNKAELADNWDLIEEYTNQLGLTLIPLSDISKSNNQ